MHSAADPLCVRMWVRSRWPAYQSTPPIFFFIFSIAEDGTHTYTIAYTYTLSLSQIHMQLSIIGTQWQVSSKICLLLFSRESDWRRDREFSITHTHTLWTLSHGPWNGRPIHVACGISCGQTQRLTLPQITGHEAMRVKVSRLMREYLKAGVSERVMGEDRWYILSEWWTA